MPMPEGIADPAVARAARIGHGAGTSDVTGCCAAPARWNGALDPSVGFARVSALPDQGSPLDSFSDPRTTNVPALPASVPQKDLLVCFSHLRWDFVFQRPQHLMTRFARRGPVVVFEEPVWTDEGAPRLELRTDAQGVAVATPHHSIEPDHRATAPGVACPCWSRHRARLGEHPSRT